MRPCLKILNTDRCQSQHLLRFYPVNKSSITAWRSLVYIRREMPNLAPVDVCFASLHEKSILRFQFANSYINHLTYPSLVTTAFGAHHKRLPNFPLHTLTVCRHPHVLISASASFSSVMAWWSTNEMQIPVFNLYSRGILRVWYLFPCQEAMATNITWHEGAVSQSERQTLLGQKV